ncbi:hypothetical protein Goshw_022812 [Gossypium schwendimanii]|uniref:Uncharacterized protein n=2 Tax=Gossypium TaxID=3633 RepID=A0A7J9MF61_GOSSC|nr:hypothetical protein [Gossypium laxum]MBA0869069.1 hypothetical protein [Gossypium schwendimanii]
MKSALPNLPQYYHCTILENILPCQLRRIPLIQNGIFEATGFPTQKWFFAPFGFTLHHFHSHSPPYVVYFSLLVSIEVASPNDNRSSNLHLRFLYRVPWIFECERHKGSILQLKLEASLTSTFWLLLFDAAADQSGTIVEILAEDGKAVSVDMVSILDFLDSK